MRRRDREVTDEKTGNLSRGAAARGSGAEAVGGGAVVQRKFIRYCIKVLDGEALNYLDEMDKIWEREINFSELREEILDGFCSYDEFMKIRYFQIMGMEVPVKDEAISEALYRLPEKKRKDNSYVLFSGYDGKRNCRMYESCTEYCALP